MRRSVLATVAIGGATFMAAPALASEDTQTWQTVTVNVALSPHYKLQNETVLRTGDARGFYELENNLMIGRKLDKVVTVWIGYTFDPLYSHGTFVRREHRFRQQVSFDNFAALGPVKLSGRVRLEQRWREGLTGTGWRLRPQIKASLPLVGTATIAFAHESFINLNNTSYQTVDGFERMRNSVAVVVPVAKHVAVDFGYLNQHGVVPGGADTSDNVITAGLTASF
jgi:hypothetical protein